MTLYSLDNIEQRFDGRVVLSIDSLVIMPGKIYGLLGPNGAGKTTLMKILAFLEQPASGNLSFNEQPVQAKHASQLRSRVVWVPQSPVMFTGSVLYNVMYPMMLKKMDKTEARLRAYELLELVAMKHMANAPAEYLSGGEAQRISAARALAAGAEVILFDEPTANLDFQARQEMQSLIFNLWKERGLSFLITTHDTRLARSLCQEVISLDSGKISCEPFLPKTSNFIARLIKADNGYCIVHSIACYQDILHLMVTGITSHLSSATLQGTPLETCVELAFHMEDAESRRMITKITLESCITLLFEDK